MEKSGIIAIIIQRSEKMFDLNTYSLSDFGRDILIALVVDAISNTILKALGAFDEIDNGSRIIILVFILIVVFSILALTRLFFGHTSFRWNHYHPVDDHQFELASCSATHKEKLSTKSKDGFQNCICGDFDWSDVDVQKVCEWKEEYGRICKDLYRESRLCKSNVV